MRKTFAGLALIAAVAAPLCALASTMEASLVPDGTYTVKVEKVQDSQHMMVRMDNGIETMLSAKGSVTFTKIKSDDTVQLSLVQGKVPVYKIK